jgi:hypothetical protein
MRVDEAALLLQQGGMDGVSDVRFDLCQRNSGSGLPKLTDHFTILSLTTTTISDIARYA